MDFLSKIDFGALFGKVKDLVGKIDWGDVWSKAKPVLGKAADYHGTLIYDHTPLFEKESDKRAETAYAVGYIKALMCAASREVFGGNG